jgi:hypothetical protein
LFKLFLYVDSRPRSGNRAIIATRRNAIAVTFKDFLDAIERIVAGAEKKSRVLSKAERRRVAYHEMGHALVAASLPGVDLVQKISIIPRGVGALGYTIQRPTEDRFPLAASGLKNRITVLVGAPPNSRCLTATFRLGPPTTFSAPPRSRWKRAPPYGAPNGSAGLAASHGAGAPALAFGRPFGFPISVPSGSVIAMNWPPAVPSRSGWMTVLTFMPGVRVLGTQPCRASPLGPPISIAHCSA